MYVKIANNSVETYPYSVRQLKTDNANVSFPKETSEELLAEWGVYPVTIVEDPTYDKVTHKIVVDSTPSLVDGVWTINKTVVEMTAEEKDAYKQILIGEYSEAVQEHLDAEAKTKLYDNIMSACSYASGTGTYATEGQAALTWRIAVWEYVEQVLADVEAETRTLPTVSELIAELPAMTWPS